MIALIFSRNGKAQSLSKNHKVQDPSERKRMKLAGMKLAKGQNRINGLAVSRVLGDHFIKDNYPGVIAEPYTSKVYKIRETDTFCIIASDGVCISFILNIPSYESQSKFFWFLFFIF